MIFNTLPGFRDFYPNDCFLQNYIFANWKAVANAFCFEEYDLPILEPLELFTKKSGDEIVEQLFAFQDKGGRHVALRPEMTPSLVRIVSSKIQSLQKPIKWFSIGENFRYERPQKGRLRSFFQFNADILGENSINADAEVISLAADLFCKFGLTEKDFHIRLSDRQLWTLLLEAEGVLNEHVTQLLTIIDQLERTSAEVTIDRLRSLISEKADDLFNKIISFKSLKSLSEIETFFSKLTIDEHFEKNVKERLSEWKNLVQRLENMNVMPFVTIDLTIVRGLAYYTGFVFEVFERAGKMRALAGGGRYDGLATKLANVSIPAVGFAAGDVTLFNLLSDLNKLPNYKKPVDFFMIIEESNLAQEIAMKDACLLRRASYKVDYIFTKATWNKQIKTANDKCASFAIFYGSDEVSNNKLTIKNLTNGQTSEFPREELLEKASKFMSCLV